MRRKLWLLNGAVFFVIGLSLLHQVWIFDNTPANCVIGVDTSPYCDHWITKEGKMMSSISWDESYYTYWTLVSIVGYVSTFIGIYIIMDFLRKGD